ncbi:DUF6338 family protein [Dyella sp.]|uniref:DUF6338 family protein n=1 Tax=Dyella sp. TaxID=1869338 RepID=UPI003F7F24DC
MEAFSTDVVSVLTGLMPGFIFAWVFYSLTTHRKPSQFDQVVYALIATTVIHPIVALEGNVLLWLGQWINLGVWSTDSKLTAGVITSLISGFGVAQLARRDVLFKLLRRLGLTARNHNTSEWCTVFESADLNIVLHLKDERRIYGWPLHWPSDHKYGHFYLAQAEWLDEKNERTALKGVAGILINAEDVDMVEFVEGEPNDQAV